MLRKSRLALHSNQEDGNLLEYGRVFRTLLIFIYSIYYIVFNCTNSSVNIKLWKKKEYKIHEAFYCKRNDPVCCHTVERTNDRVELLVAYYKVPVKSSSMCCSY